MEVALFALLESWGVSPDFLMGHSIGELAAAHVAGVFTLQDACALVAARGRLMGALPEGGAMVAIGSSEREVAGSLEGLEGRVSLAAVNGPRSVVISGDQDAVLDVASVWGERGIKTKRLRVSHAFHSPRMDAMLEEFAEVASGLSFAAPRLPIVSNLTGAPVADERICSPGYWVEHVRRPVRFMDGVRWLRAQGVSSFLELGPDGVLSAIVDDCLSERPGEAHDADPSARGTGPAEGRGADAVVAVSLLRGERPEAHASLTALAKLWVNGTTVDWAALFNGSGAKRVALPTYAFQRERYWLPARAAAGDGLVGVGQAVVGHPLLGAMVGSADGDRWLFSGRVSTASHPWLCDHAVLGRVLLPGTAFLELALCAGGCVGCGAVRELTLEAPLVLCADEEILLQVVVGIGEKPRERPVAIYSRPGSPVGDDGWRGEGGEGWTRHASGVLAAAGTVLNGRATAMRERAKLLQSDVWPPRDAQAIELDGLYDALAARGFEYGPAFQGLRAAWRHGDELFAEIACVSGAEGEGRQAGDFGVHPALLDAALHVGLSVLANDGNGCNGAPGDGSARLPFSFNGVELHAREASSLRVSLSLADDGGELSLLAADGDGGLVASIGSLVTREVSTAQLDVAARTQPHDALLTLVWRELPAAAASRPAAAVREDAVAVVGRRDSLLVGSLERAGTKVEVFSGVAALGEALNGDREIPGMVLWDGGPEQMAGPAAPAAGIDDRGDLDMPLAARRSVESALTALQAWLADRRFASSRLVLVTCERPDVGGGAADAGEYAGAGAAKLDGGGVVGLVRSAQAEHPGRFALVDIDGDESSWGVLGDALERGEPQVLVRGGSVSVPRLARAGAGDGLTVPQADEGWRLEVGDGGTFEGLELVPVSVPAGASHSASGGALARGEVRIGVRALGLNFRDVLIALGMYPGEAVMGGEGAGVVLEVGPGVEGLTVGERVMGLCPGFGSVAVVDSRLVAKVPDGWSFARAASIPTVFLTAFYGLVDLAGLRPGERVLVHAGAGGVGMAAIQLARHLGAEVFATASPSKWGALQSLGLDDAHIASSRSLEFVKRFRAATGGRGVDVVLNSLAGEFVDGSLELLNESGRFVEMGKTDVRAPGEVAAAHPGVAYRAFDLSEAGTERLGEMLGELLALFQTGALRPVPVRAWDIRRAPEAFRFMSQARHVGKNVLMLPQSAIDPQGTVLITGGTGGLGALLARHLVARHGVRHLLLASRRGEDAEGAAQLRGELEALGADVRIAACDVSERESVRALLESIEPEHPLRAVLHAAGVLDDAVIGSLSARSIQEVMAAKADAAWHLHELTQHQDLRAFILFSSAAGVLGSPGQGNYAAANSLLDALAVYRDARGLPAISLAWGLWDPAVGGMAQGMSETDISRMARAGVRMITREHGLELFDAALQVGEPLTLPLPLDLRALRAQARAGTLPALFSELVSISTPRQADERTEVSLTRRLAAIPEDQRENTVFELVNAQVAAVLGHSTAETIDDQLTFKELGFDSLTAVELRNRLNSATQLQLPTTLVFDYPTVGAVARHVLSEVATEQTVVPGDAELDRLEQVLPSIASDGGERARIEGRLESLLAGVRRLGRDDGVAAAGDEIHTATDDELFRYLDEKAYTSRETRLVSRSEGGPDDE